MVYDNYMCVWCVIIILFISVAIQINQMLRFYLDFRCENIAKTIDRMIPSNFDQEQVVGWNVCISF